MGAVGVCQVMGVPADNTVMNINTSTNTSTQTCTCTSDGSINVIIMLDRLVMLFYFIP